jgi:hypothetical protein
MSTGLCPVLTCCVATEQFEQHPARTFPAFAERSIAPEYANTIEMDSGLPFLTRVNNS